MEINYINLIKDILENGEESDDRTGTGTIRLFARELRFDISNSFPLYTTRKLYLKGIIEELLWFLRGETDSKILEDKDVNIWKGNTSREFLDKRGLTEYPEGEAGANYSWQWRNFGGSLSAGPLFRQGERIGTSIQKQKNGVDQIKTVLESLKSDPFGRRHLIVAWNPLQLELTPLPPCHYSIQFYVSKLKELSCKVCIRSQDVALGNPFNVASYAAMTYIFCNYLGYTPKDLIISMGDTHIYKNHIKPLKEQIEREPFDPPKLLINKDLNTLKDIESLQYEDFVLQNYEHHPPIKMAMSV